MALIGGTASSVVDHDHLLMKRSSEWCGSEPCADSFAAFMMLRPALLTILLPSLYGPWLSAKGQTDSAGIGGESNDVRYPDPALELAEEHVIWDVNDSLSKLPGYDLYCSWNTETIFPPSEAVHKAHAGRNLRLSTAACDHAFPICGEVNSDFGPRHGRMHYGVDIDLETGDAVVAAFEGVVRVARRHRTFGNVVVIRHWNGLETLYGHLSELKVHSGQEVLAGDTIGLGGSTGRSTGSHLHFETRFLGSPIDPKFIFDLESGELKSRELAVTPGMVTSASASRHYHIVRKGDTLSRIAAVQGTTVKALCTLNRMGTRSVLRIGQRLRVR